ncbi:hypothetical protein DOY81_002364 [Sarcophaga bullata]|nr:hypothetical protein DOY81_002364 [Sarcophaga bullata]
MAFEYITFCNLLSAANNGFVLHATYAAVPTIVKYGNPVVDAVASIEQNILHSFNGTLSSYSKSVNTFYSSVHKSDTRINNCVYIPDVAKTLTYAAPAVTKTIYVHAATAIPKTVTYDSAAIYNHADPTVTKAVYVYESPIVHR